MKNWILKRKIALVWIMTWGCWQGHCEYKTFILSSQNTNYPTSTNYMVSAKTVVEVQGGSAILAGLATWSVYVSVFFPESPGSTNLTTSLMLPSSTGPTPIIVGPALIKMSLPDNYWNGYCTLRITEQGEAFTPANAVVIPADAKGPVAIIMESSMNLVDWVRAEPGTYGASSHQRFFRIRAVHQ